MAVRELSRLGIESNFQETPLAALQEQARRIVSEYAGKKGLSLVTDDIKMTPIRRVRGHAPGIFAHAARIRFTITPKMGERLGVRNEARLLEDELAERIAGSNNLFEVWKLLEKGQKVTLTSEKEPERDLSLDERRTLRMPIILIGRRLKRPQNVDIHLSSIRIAPEKHRVVVSIGSADTRLKAPLRELAEKLARELGVEIFHHV